MLLMLQRKTELSKEIVDVHAGMQRCQDFPNAARKCWVARTAQEQAHQPEKKIRLARPEKVSWIRVVDNVKQKSKSVVSDCGILMLLHEKARTLSQMRGKQSR